MGIKVSLETVRAELRPGCRLVAVTKTQPPSKILEAYEAGQRLFGENRVQEMREKQPQLPDDVEWHLVGHLQSNKVKYIAPWVSLIHSVDNLSLLEEVSRQGARARRVIPCLHQVHISREETKFGFLPGELDGAVSNITESAFPHAAVIGLMGMATLTDHQEIIRSEFRTLKEIFDRIGKRSSNLNMRELSMGMSGDYKIAMEEGSTLVRVGSAIFGERNK